jgi:predicted MFS family arabinose efflux permease
MNKALMYSLRYLPFIIPIALATDMYVSAIPMISDEFEIDSKKIQLMLCSFVLVFGISQLIIGIFIEKIGIKNILNFSAVLFTLGSIICFLAECYITFLIGRILQAIGAAGTQIIAYTLVRVNYDKALINSIISYIKVGCAFSPLLSPPIGAFIILHFGWRMIFIILFVLGLIIMSLSQGYIQNISIHKTRYALRDFRQILLNPTFLYYTICSTLSQGCVFANYAISPFYYISLHHFNEIYFSYLFSFNSAISIVSGLWVAKNVNQVGINTISFRAAILIVGCAIAMKLGNYFTDHYLIFMISGFIFQLAAMMMLTSSLAGILTNFKDSSFIASTLFFFIETVGSGLIGLLLINENNISVDYFINILFCSGIIALLLNTINSKKQFRL